MKRATLSLSFDNLGEAAEIGAGALAPDAPGVGSHPTATEVLPRLLDLLAARSLVATFFVEGLNAELYPDRLREIDAGGHEVAFHAWAHEQWDELTADEQADNLARGIDAFGAAGLTMSGIRPPGGGLGAGGLATLRDAGLTYCSPAGTGAGTADGMALLPFRWRHVDATCVLPGLGTVREQMLGSAEPIDPDRFLAYLEEELGALAEGGGFATLVLHPFLLEWLGEDRLDAILERIEADRTTGDLWVAPCREVAQHVLAHLAEFEGATTLDPTSWSG
jgi:peptidoglycan/xylan/chitin deacetylase (PgdA/CDA1 family)